MAISGGNEKNKESKNPPAPAYSLCAPWDASRLWNSLVVLRKPPAKPSASNDSSLSPLGA